MGMKVPATGYIVTMSTYGRQQPPSLHYTNKREAVKAANEYLLAGLTDRARRAGWRKRGNLSKFGYAQIDHPFFGTDSYAKIEKAETYHHPCWRDYVWF